MPLRNVMTEKYFTILLPQLGLKPCTLVIVMNTICACFNKSNI